MNIKIYLIGAFGQEHLGIMRLQPCAAKKRSYSVGIAALASASKRARGQKGLRKASEKS